MNYESDYIKKLYDVLDEKRQVELCSTINDLVKEELIEILENKDFIGIDASLEESLFEYGIVYREKDSLVIRYQNNIYDYSIVTNEELLEIINNMKDGFFKWCDITKEYYLQWFNTCNNKSICIKDIIQYSDRLYECFNLTDKDNDIIRVITLLNNEKD